MTRIFIEDQELDITQDIVYSLTFAIDDMVNIDSKATSFSKTIVIPGTNRNNTLFGNIFDFGNANFTAPGNNVFYNFDASRSAKARIEINGLEAMRGILRLMRIVHDKGAVEYEIALFGELGGLMSSIGNKRLEDLDFTKYNHAWNVTNIVDSWDTTFAQLTAASGVDFSASLRRIRIDDELWTKLKAGDEIDVTGTANNDGVYTIRRIQFVYFPLPGITDIFVNEALVDGTNDAITIDRLNSGFGNGYVYPLINYGKVTDNINGTRYKDWQFKAFRPAIFVKEYMDRIITGAGYTWQSDFFNTSFFERLIIPNNDIALQNISSSFYIEANTSEALTKTTNQSGISEAVLWDNRPTLNNFTYSSGKYTYTPSDSKSISFFLNITGNISRSVNGGGSIVFYLYVNDVIVHTQQIEFDGRTTDIDFTINHSATVRTGDEVYLGYTIAPVLRYELVSGGGFGSNTINVTFTSNTWNINIDATMTAEPNPKGYIEYSYGDTINMNHVIPKNVFQRDFFLSIVKLFNLMVIEDKGVERRLIIEPDATFYNTNKATYLNWTDKVDRSQPITITPMSETNARYYQLSYKSDNDFYNEEYKKKFNENYGDRIFDNELEFAKDTQKLEVIFSSSVLTGFDTSGMIFPTICKITNDEEEAIAHNIRIMQIKVKDIAEYDILNDGTVLDSPTKYLYAGHFDDPDNVGVDLNFGATRQLYFEFTTGDLSVNMFNAFYSPYMAEIIDKDSRLVTASVKLTDIDIFQLDFRRFIFIDGILYRLKKIIDWTTDNICKVELLRAINTTYVPQAFMLSRGLVLTFDYLSNADALVGDATDLNDWNTFFDLPAYGNPFTNIEVGIDTITLYGGSNITVKTELFKDNSNLQQIDDQAGSIVKINDDGFFNTANLSSVKMPALIEVGDSVFESTVLAEIEAPLLRIAGEKTFYQTFLEYADFPNLIKTGPYFLYQCTSLNKVNLPSCTDLGGTVNNDGVFEAISGNTIDAVFNSVLETNNGGLADGDILYFSLFNTVTITYV